MQKLIESLGIAQIKHHIFLCCDQTKPKCCSYEQGLVSWEYLKNRLKELNLTDVYRSKANCLRVCTQGPIAVVYSNVPVLRPTEHAMPSNTNSYSVWYHSCTPAVLERIIQEHFIAGKIVVDYLL